MTPLLSEIGLALDVVGAAVLARGLFRGMQSSGYGDTFRTKETVAEDRAYGLVGLLFLGLGFFLQFLSNLGLGEVSHTWCGIVAGGVALVGGGVAAYLLYGLVNRKAKAIWGFVGKVRHFWKRRRGE